MKIRKTTLARYLVPTIVVKDFAGVRGFAKPEGRLSERTMRAFELSVRICKN
jgi:hypothetical protein